jgi:hypothetical protein
MAMSKLHIVAGLVLLATGVLWSVAERFGIMRLPGDVVIERDNFPVYTPVTTSIVLSLLLSFGFWLFGGRGGDVVIPPVI